MGLPVLIFNFNLAGWYRADERSRGGDQEAEWQPKPVETGEHHVEG